MKAWRLSLVGVFLLALMLGGCGGGSGSDASPAPEPAPEPTTLRIQSLNPGSAGTGQTVRVEYSAGSGTVSPAAVSDGFDHGTLRIVLGGEEIVPQSAEDGRATFRVPVGVTGSRSLFLRAGELESNTLLFTISDTISVIAPEPEDWIEADDGTRVVRNLVLLFIDEGRDLDAVAAAAATAEAGEVVGRIDPLRARQLRLPTLTYEQLVDAIERLEAMDGVADAILDFEAVPEFVSLDWTRDPDLLDQRASNRVEEGAQAYISAVHPTFPGLLVPYFRSMGVYESGVHFGLDDYAGYASRGGSRSGGIALYAPDSPEASHGSDVLGLIAAELFNGRAAGLLSALGVFGNHGGFNVLVDNSGWTITGRLAHLTSALESGAREFNISAGGHLKCTGLIDAFGFCSGERPLQATGDLVTEDANLFGALQFRSYRKVFSKLISLAEQSYPDAIFVVTAGNGNTDGGDPTFRFFGSHPSQQVFVVGAHGPFLNPSRTSFSNFGERVDIAAAGWVVSSFDGTSVPGTSVAAPLVTATIAAMRSIDPDLTPAQVMAMLRETALPIEENVVELHDQDGNRIGCTVFVRPLTDNVDGNGCRSGHGARLNVEGAIEAAIASREGRTRREGDRLDVVITGGETVTRSVNVTVPDEGAVFDRVDIMFLVDVSSSYRSSIAQFKTRAADLVNAFEASGTNVSTGLASFSDFPISPWGGETDYAYRLDQALATNADDTIAAINGLRPFFGDDGPESQLEALYQLATGAGRTVDDQPGAGIPASSVGWRDGALRIIFLATDASFHNPEPGTTRHTPGYPGASWTQTVNALNAQNIRVFGLERGSTVTDVRAIVEETNGEVFQLDSASSQIVDAVQEALEGVAASLDLKLVPNGDFAGMIRSITPSQIDGVNRGETVSFAVELARGDGGPGEHVFVFRLIAVADGTAVIEEIPVVVNLK